MFKELVVGLAAVLAVLIPLALALILAPWILILLIVLAGILVPAYLIGESILQYKRWYM